jgi:hypothetical protein
MQKHTLKKGIEKDILVETGLKEMVFYCLAGGLASWVAGQLDGQLVSCVDGGLDSWLKSLTADWSAV